MGMMKRLFTQAQIDAENRNCGRCGEPADTTCCCCGRPLCVDCSHEEECGEVLCVVCGIPINHDWDIDFEDEGGGIHRRCE